MSKTLQAIRGMNDILPADGALWLYLEDTARRIFEQYGYRFVRMPIVENTALFVRGIGEATDVVEKEMYTFEDGPSKEKESLTLRPEATAGIVRAAIEHNLTYERGQRVWTHGAMFRHERPQKGRYRQFYQLDVEALDFAGPDVDAEQIVLLARLWKELGLTDAVRLKINTIGDQNDRRAYRETLITYFSRYPEQLDDDSRRRLHRNPLRILDSKNPAMQTLIENAPRMLDHINPDARTHFEALQALLRQAGIDFEIDTRLVRGLDYYNRTVFEWVTDRLGAQGTVAGGGRYDGLFELLGGKSTPACGFAAGIERLILLLQERKTECSDAPAIYLVFQGDEVVAFAWRVAETLRNEGYALTLNAGGGNFKSQMKKADASGARIALILGDDEAHSRTITVKWLRDTDKTQHTGEQERVSAAELGRWLKAHGV
ncbi:MAG: histidine--tRNA ligase [Burkholderiales bacterium]|jgi:histidyl-tRNA synthetase|nr:histidine--tRNA ligase [Burkholderiales bacterium]